jgi:hypothetical protein
MGEGELARWDYEEMPIYRQRIAMLGCMTLMVNYLADPDLNDGSFGGAAAVSIGQDWYASGRSVIEDMA